MRKKYIYLARFFHQGKVYLYVGRHMCGPNCDDKWDGELPSPNYKSSSRIARTFNMDLLDMTVLEDCTNQSDEYYYDQEANWIIAYASDYGIAKELVCLPNVNYNHYWVHKQTWGSLINCQYEDTHLNQRGDDGLTPRERYRLNNPEEYYERMLKPFLDAAHSEDALAKSLQTRKENGSFERSIKAFTTAANQPDSVARRTQTMIDNGTYDRVMKNMNSPENVAKREATKKERGSYRIGAAKVRALWESRKDVYVSSICFTSLPLDSHVILLGGDVGKYSRLMYQWDKLGRPDIFTCDGICYCKVPKT